MGKPTNRRAMRQDIYAPILCFETKSRSALFGAKRVVGVSELESVTSVERPSASSIR